MHRYGSKHRDREIGMAWLEEHHSASAAVRSARGRLLGEVAMSAVPRVVSELLPPRASALGLLPRRG
jgi:hypothetical protein